MKLLHNIGFSPSADPRIASNYNTPDQVSKCQEPLSFDGIYRNVYANRKLLIGKEVTLFIMGDYVGGDNSFDERMPYEVYCSWDELKELEKLGFKLGWHTWSHPDLTRVSDEQLAHELSTPFPMEEFAYPYGKYDERVMEAVRRAGFKKAWSVTQGDNQPFSLYRDYL